MLDHFSGFEDQWTLDLGSRLHSPDVVAEELTSRGAGSFCWAMSSDPKVDGQSLPLREALRSVVGSGFGTLLICTPGRLAFYEGEEPGDRTILRRQ
jgi:hypothetical protein